MTRFRIENTKHSNSFSQQDNNVNKHYWKKIIPSFAVLTIITSMKVLENGKLAYQKTQQTAGFFWTQCQQ